MTDVDWWIMFAILQSINSQQGGMATKGTSMATAHWIIITFDGAGCTDHDSGVRLAIFCGSVKLLNQSPNSIYNLVTYRAADHAEHLVTLNARFAGVRPALCRCATPGPLRSPSPSHACCVCNRLYSDGELRPKGKASGVFQTLCKAGLYR